MTSELKPCPFCGDSKHLIIDDYHDPEMDGYFGFTVICNAAGWDGVERGCGASGAWGETEEEAARIWNTRAVPGVPELVRYRIWFDSNYNEIVDEDQDGDWCEYNQAAAIIRSMIPRVNNCGRYIAERNDGTLMYLNHGNTWKGCDNFIAANDKEIERLREALREVHTMIEHDRTGKFKMVQNVINAALSEKEPS